MIPRTVQVANVISSVIGVSETTLGNVLGPVSTGGWSNSYPEFFLGEESTLGKPTSYTSRVHSWSEGQPQYSQRPTKRFGVGLNAIMHPVADSLTEPPLTVITGF